MLTDHSDNSFMLGLLIIGVFFGFSFVNQCRFVNVSYTSLKYDIVHEMKSSYCVMFVDLLLVLKPLVLT